MLYAAKNGLSFGASYLNAGGEIKFEERGDPPPRTKKFGASYKFAVKPANLLDPGADITYCDMIVSADWTRTDTEKGYYQAGTEANLTLSGKLVFAFRLGYLAGRDSAGTAYGLGMRGKNWGLDLSFAPSESLDSVSQATASYKF